MKLESQNPDSLRSSLPPYKLPFNYTHSSTSLQTTVCSSDSLILSDQTNFSNHFSSLNSTIMCKQMEMYGQERYTITSKNNNKKEMYNLTSTVSPLSLSLSHILSAILGFPKLKIVFNLTNELHIGRIVY